MYPPLLLVALLLQRAEAGPHPRFTIPTEKFGETYGYTFAPDGKLFAVSDDKGQHIVVWDLSSQSVIQRLATGETDPNGCVFAFSPDARFFAAPRRDGSFLMWDTEKWKLRTVPLAEKPLDRAPFAISPDGKTLGIGCEGRGNYACLIDLGSGKIRHVLKLDYHAVTDLAFSPDGKYHAVAVGHRRTSVSNPKYSPVQLGVWQIATGKRVVFASNVHTRVINALQFSPDSKLLCTASSDKTARIWDVATGKELHRLAHKGEVHSAAFFPDGKRLVTVSDKMTPFDRSTATLWDVMVGRELKTVQLDAGAKIAAFTPDRRGMFVFDVDAKRKLRLGLWDLDGTGK